jgi:hypothetical protein
MAMLPSGFIVSTTGVYTNYPTEKIGGVAAGVTSATTVTAGQPLTSVMPLSSILPTSIVSTRRSRVIAASGTAHAYSAAKATTISSGTFAYDQDEFMIMGVTDTINGLANTKIKMVGGDGFRQRRAIKLKDRGAGHGTAFRAGYFNFTGVTAQRTNWSTAPSALTNTFKSTTSNSTDADDHAQYVTWRTEPGELTYMGASGVVPFTDNYKAKTG